MSFTQRWKGRTKKEVSQAMTALAHKRSESMTMDQKKDHANMMVKARKVKKII